MHACKSRHACSASTSLCTASCESSFCKRLFTCICMYVCMYVSIYLSIHPSIHPSIYLSFRGRAAWTIHGCMHAYKTESGQQSDHGADSSLAPVSIYLSIYL